MKKLKKALTKMTSLFAGSWWGVLIHLLWFSFWLLFRIPTSILLLIVNLEAIIIGIIILKSEREEVAAREQLEKYERESDREIIERDLETDEYTRRELTTIKQELRLIKEMIREIKS